jgi:hypothetical protein
MKLSGALLVLLLAAAVLTAHARSEYPRPRDNFDNDDQEQQMESADNQQQMDGGGDEQESVDPSAMAPESGDNNAAPQGDDQSAEYAQDEGAYDAVGDSGEQFRFARRRGLFDTLKNAWNNGVNAVKEGVKSTINNVKKAVVCTFNNGHEICKEPAPPKPQPLPQPVKVPPRPRPIIRPTPIVLPKPKPKPKPPVIHARGPDPRNRPLSASDIEDCVACRYVWLQVELQVGNSQLEENIYDAFTSACIEAQKAPIFYAACDDMFDDVYGMIGDYMEGYTVNQVCEGAKMCR